MKILGLPVPFTGERQKALSQPGQRGGWYPIISESFAGAFQRNVTVNRDSVLSNHAVFACQTLIASDIAKLRMRLVQRDANGIWTEVENRSFQVIGKPNLYQTRIQFFESWVLSKLQNGNAYILKERDQSGKVVALHVLDPTRTRPLVSDAGGVFYEINADKLAGQTAQVTVPASEIIHDRFNCLFHPLVGLSPIFAGGLAAMQGLAIQEDSALFFQNGARPSGVLTAPGAIAEETADRLKAYWDTNFSGANSGKVAVLGDGLHYEAMRAKAIDSQVIDQLKWTAEVVCSTYHVPPYKIGQGATPSYNNIQSLNVEYYSQCLQKLIEDIELCMDEGLGLNGDAGTGKSLGTEFDLDGLLRMDASTQMDVLEKSKGKLTPNEQRKRLNQKPVIGGDTVYMQEQDHSLEWLARRDAMPLEGPPDPEPDAALSISPMAFKAKCEGHHQRKAA